MDPFTIATSVARLASFAIQIIEIANNYVSSVLHRKESILILISELRILQFNLEGLNKFLRSKMADVPVVFKRTSVLRSCTTACEEKLRNLWKKLSLKEGSKLSTLIWPLNESEHQKIIEDLRAFAQ
jgi:hypothetical protein